jgi:hypothetical protein
MKNGERFHENEILYNDTDNDFMEIKTRLSSMYDKCDKILKLVIVQF